MLTQEKWHKTGSGVLAGRTSRLFPVAMHPNAILIAS